LPIARLGVGIVILGEAGAVRSNMSAMTSTPCAWSSASSGERATLTRMVTDTSGCSAIFTSCMPIALIGVEHDLVLGDLVALRFQRFGQIAGRHRAVELAGVGRLADQLDGDAVDPFESFSATERRSAFWPRCARGWLRTPCGWLVGAQRLAVGKEEVAGKPFFTFTTSPMAPSFSIAFEQDDFHCSRAPYFTT
jgi:hypothetical protein